MKRKLVVLLLFTMLLTGCTNSADSEIMALKSLKALNSDDSTVNNYNLSYADSQRLVYAQVSDRTLLDLSQLEACTDNELQAVQNYMNAVDNQLTGSLSYKDGLIDKCFTDYLLVEFEQTPYYWQRSSMIVRGKDAESGAIVCDVKYKTIGFQKEVIPESKIALGSPNYETLMKVRFQRWNSLMNMKFRGGSSARDFEEDYNEFVKAYGTIEEILASQSRESLTENIYLTGNQITYTGMIDSTEEQSGATMTVRYVIVPNYVLGVNLGLTCEHMYITDYQLDKDPTDGLKLFTQEGYQTVTDAVYEMLYSYFQCMDEDDYDGMYKLTKNYETTDKYWKDIFTATYRKHNNFSLSVFDITGTHITCGVKVATKIRAKGSNMTMPSYTDRYFFEVELVDGKLKVINSILISRELEGEPAITTDEADRAGFVASVDLDNEDKVDIEKLISAFGQLQLLKDTTSDTFGDVVDLSMSSSKLNNLKSNMTSLSGAKKATWLLTYMEGTSNFASVKCKELFQAEDNGIVETSVIYNFILKGNTWYIYGYDILSQVKLDTTNLNTTGNLCVVKPDGIVSYNSQVTNTNSSVDLDNLTDVSKTYTYEEYTPILKSGVIEQGYAKVYASDLTDEKRAEVYDTVRILLSDEVSANMESIIANFDTNFGGYLPEEYGTQVFDELACIYYNKVKGMYLGDEYKVRKAEYLDVYDIAVEEWKKYNFSDEANEAYQQFKSLCNAVRRAL